MKKILAYCLLWAMPVLAVISVVLEKEYVDTRPRQPRQEEGRVYPLSVHGTVVYLTKTEDITATWLFPGGMLCAIVGAALMRSIKQQNR